MPTSLLPSQLSTLRFSAGELYAHVEGDPFPNAQSVVERLAAELVGG
jgi:hypothetical protein